MPRPWPGNKPGPREGQREGQGDCPVSEKGPAIKSNSESGEGPDLVGTPDRGDPGKDFGFYRRRNVSHWRLSTGGNMW